MTTPTTDTDPLAQDELDQLDHDQPELDQTVLDQTVLDQTVLDQTVLDQTVLDQKLTGRLRRMLRHPGFRWGLAVLGVVVLILVTISVFNSTINNLQVHHPSSPRPDGAAAVAQLLRDEGVDLVVVDTPARAIAETDSNATLAIARGERVPPEIAADLARAGAGKMILLRPTTTALENFSVPAAITSADSSSVLEPVCGDPVAERAGTMTGLRSAIEVDAPVIGCYPHGTGYGYAQVAMPEGSIDLVTSGYLNSELGLEGNAAFSLGVLGSKPKLVWFMPAESAATTSSGDTSAPTLLPDWWPLACLQAGLAVLILGIWRGRRLGPILSERLPVKVRSSETVEGHGRLYFRLGARDRAAAALRAGSVQRLGAVFGHRDDPAMLAQVVAQRIGRDVPEVRLWLAGPAPPDDDQLTALARNLDQLEQEALRP